MPSITIIGKDEKKFDLAKGSSLTELDHVLIFGCRMAACGACAVEIISGANHLSAMQIEEKKFLEDIGIANGPYRLACQCKVFGDVSLKQC